RTVPFVDFVRLALLLSIIWLHLQEPAIFEVGCLGAPTKDSTGASTPSDPSASIPAFPRDCAAELNAMICYPRLGTFAAVPLMYGKRLMGALWIAIVVPNADGDITRTTAIDVNSQLRCVASGPSGPPSNTKGSWREEAARSQTLLGNTAALGQLGLSTSMALALAAGGDIDYISWLATCVRRLASCATLHTLIAGVCSTISRHVRLRFHADVAVQAALVPEADSTVAFMLCSETKAAGGSPGPGGIVGGPGPGGAPCSRLLNRAASNGRRTATDSSRAGAAASEMARQPAGGDPNPGSGSRSGYASVSAFGPRNGVTGKPSRMPAHRAPPRALLPVDCAIIAIETSCGTDVASHSATTTSTATTAAVTTIDTIQPQGLGSGGGGSGIAPSPASQQEGCCPERTEDQKANGCYTIRICPSAGPGHIQYMSAKPFHLSHTLLSRLVSNAVAHRPSLHVPVGIIVPDTARHVTDVRQPSRDVCMLIGSMAGSIWQQNGSPGGFSGGFVDQSVSRRGPGSLMLLAMEVARGGCMLALYVAFPNLMPQPLLTAARESCEQLLRHMLVALVRHKLQTSEIGPNLDTLRLGVPGSYVSIGHVRDHIDQRGLSMASSFTTSPSPKPISSNVCELQLSQPADGKQELEAHLDGISLRTTMPGSSTSAGCSRGGTELLPQPYLTSKSSPLQPNGNQQQQFNLHPHHRGMDPANESSACWASHEESPAKMKMPALLPARKLQQPHSRYLNPFQGNGMAVREGSAGGSSSMGNRAATAGIMSGAQPHVLTSIFNTSDVINNNTGLFGRSQATILNNGMLDSSLEDEEIPTVVQEAMMTVHGLDDTWGMRGMMGTLVESIMTTLKDNISELVGEAPNSGEASNARAKEGLEDLDLSHLLGYGANGAVFKGMLGTVPVAIK
ncbi:hypothetical protein VaNZ11_010859, partial [Volvox africanus]